MAEIDSRQLRNVMGRFATGVTVLTARVGSQTRGMTANAVCSLSLHPPLILVCIDHSASMHPMFEVAEAFGVNILSVEQRAMSEFFAAHGEKPDPMGGFPYRLGPIGTPLLEGTLGWAECRIAQRYAGGDHTIVVGRVEDLGHEDGAVDPLLFFAGKYRALGDVV